MNFEQMKPRILDFGLIRGQRKLLANPESGGRESEFLLRATRAKSTSVATTTFFQQRSPRARAQSKIQNPKSEIRINERGYTLAGALTLLAVMSILMAISLPLWSRVKQRDMEDEMIFRGNEYVEAIARYHQKFGSYPPDLETLEKLKFIRKLYADPMTKSGKWKALHPDALLQTGAAGTINVPGSKDNDEGDTEGKAMIMIMIMIRIHVRPG